MNISRSRNRAFDEYVRLLEKENIMLRHIANTDEMSIELIDEIPKETENSKFHIMEPEDLLEEYLKSEDDSPIKEQLAEELQRRGYDLTRFN